MKMKFLLILFIFCSVNNISILKRSFKQPPEEHLNSQNSISSSQINTNDVPQSSITSSITSTQEKGLKTIGALVFEWTGMYEPNPPHTFNIHGFWDYEKYKEKGNKEKENNELKSPKNLNLEQVVEEKKKQLNLFKLNQKKFKGKWKAKEGKSKSFWEYEYYKHKDVFNYDISFTEYTNKIFYLAEKIDINNVIAPFLKGEYEDIIVINKYKFEQALKKKTNGQSIELICKHIDNWETSVLLVRIKFLYDKSLNPLDGTVFGTTCIDFGRSRKEQTIGLQNRIYH